MIDKQIITYFAGKKILITGGTGMIGRQVTKILCDADATVTIASLDKIEIDPRANHVYCDLTNLELCKKVAEGMDCVFHLAGVKGSMEVSKTMLASHFVPTLMMNTNVLEACRVNNVQKTLYTSSIGAYTDSDVFKETTEFGGPPLDFAGWAKRMGELQIHAYKVQYGLENFSIVRPSAVYGPGDNFDPKTAMFIPSILAKIHKKSGPIEVWGDGSAIRDIAFSRDIAEGVILALYNGTQGEYINLGSGSGHTVKEVIEALSSFIDFEYTFDTSKASGTSKKLMDISKANSLLGYSPSTSLVEGLKETWEWYLENINEHKSKQNYFKKIDT